VAKAAVVYQLTTNTLMCRDEAKQQLVNVFLAAHGIDPMRFIVGTALYVRRHEDDTLWLHTWQALEGLPLCEHCEACVKSEPVNVPLVTPAPAIEEAFVADGSGVDAEGLQVTWATGPIDDSLVQQIREIVRVQHGGSERRAFGA
jgi:hypothetical protein